MMDGRMIRNRKPDIDLARWIRLPSAILRTKVFSTKRGFTLMELTITIVVGAILMMGMLPLIRIAAHRGGEAQFQMRDVVELQSLVERISAWGATRNVAAMKSQLGSAPGAKSGIDNLGDFYLHSANFIEFDGSHQALTSTSNTNLLEVRVGLDSSGPSLSKVFVDNQ